MRILYLYSELMGYQIPVLKEYLKEPESEIVVISWDKNKLTPYQIPDIPAIKFYKRSEFTAQKLMFFCDQYNPDIIFTSGWMDWDYLKTARQQKKKGKLVVAGMDTQWEGKLKQIVARLISPFYFKRTFTHIFIAGLYQYEYARKLGFSNSQIIQNCYSADTDLFNRAFLESIEEKKRNYPHKLLFVGRLAKQKGIHELIEAFTEFKSTIASDWKLLIIGNGPEEIHATDDLEIKNFVQPNDLANEIKHCGCFILPSQYEPWGVVLHEFSAAGLPLISSMYCGANTQFLINGFNGFSIKPNSQEIVKCLIKLSKLSDSQLIEMSIASNKLSKRIDPEITAKSFLSALNQ
jgi:glycosyltransferase involved in cell wall biosynthesis